MSNNARDEASKNKLGESAQLFARDTGSDSEEEEEDAMFADNESPNVFASSVLRSTLDIIASEFSVRRALLCAHLLRLLGTISARIAVTNMNAHNLALCLAPSMLQWDPNGMNALLILNKMMQFIMQLIEESRIHMESLDSYCESLSKNEYLKAN